jgi:6-phosphogluconolactonase (cycloisomerase 2 family)
MKRSVQLIAFIVASLSTAALAQDAVVAPSSSSPVAYVYVSNNPTSTTTKVNAYAVASSGTLTSVSGSPFSIPVGYMALNGKYFFGTNGTYIYSYSIAPDGALTYVSKLNVTEKNPYDSGGPGNLFLDHTGASLYDGDIYAYGTGDNAYQFFDINNDNGHFYYLGLSSDGGENAGTVLSFIGNNEYAYTAGCYHGGPPQILAYKRSGSGSLTQLSITAPIPTAPPNEEYCSYLAAADPTNHLAVSMTPTDDITQVGPPQLAVYTADSSGNLTTNSTLSNMPTTQVTNVTDMWMAPSGQLLAVSGTSGLQVFHFNGSNPITPYTGLLTSSQVDQMFWDNDNHLYAISRSAGKLYVFTVTPTSYSQAPGSPYTIATPMNIIVLPKS